jgi:hypothetical protein
MDRCLEGEHIENFRLEIAGSVQTRYRREGVGIIIENVARIVRDQNRWSFCVNHNLFNGLAIRIRIQDRMV